MKLNYKNIDWTFFDIEHGDGFDVNVINDNYSIAENGTIVKDWKGYDSDKEKNSEHVLAYAIVGNKNLVSVRITPDHKNYCVYINEQRLDSLKTFGTALAKAESYSILVD